jgi:hypothetical protein
MVSAGIDPQTVVLEEAARRVDANHAIAQPTAQTIAPAIPEMMLVAAPVVQISPQAAGTPCGPGGTWLMHASHALSVASRYPPAKATGISRLNTKSNQAFLNWGLPLPKAARTSSSLDDRGEGPLQICGPVWTPTPLGLGKKTPKGETPMTTEPKGEAA